MSLYLDLESLDDINRMTSPGLFLEMNRQKMIIFDKVQEMPELFPILRSEIDNDRRPGRSFLLGSDLFRLITRVRFPESYREYSNEVSFRWRMTAHL